jgi:hypothetical protein
MVLNYIMLWNMTAYKKKYQSNRTAFACPTSEYL